MSRVLISPKPVDKNGTRVPSVTFSVHEAGAWYIGTAGSYSVPDASLIPAAVDLFATLHTTTAVQSFMADVDGNVEPFYIDRSSAQLVIVGVVDGNYHIEPIDLAELPALVEYNSDDAPYYSDNQLAFDPVNNIIYRRGRFVLTRLDDAETSIVRNNDRVHGPGHYLLLTATNRYFMSDGVDSWINIGATEPTEEDYPEHALDAAVTPSQATGREWYPINRRDDVHLEDFKPLAGLAGSDWEALNLAKDAALEHNAKLQLLGKEYKIDQPIDWDNDSLNMIGVGRRRRISEAKDGTVLRSTIPTGTAFRFAGNAFTIKELTINTMTDGIAVDSDLHQLSRVDSVLIETRNAAVALYLGIAFTETYSEMDIYNLDENKQGLGIHHNTENESVAGGNLAFRMVNTSHYKYPWEMGQEAASETGVLAERRNITIDTCQGRHGDVNMRFGNGYFGVEIINPWCEGGSKGDMQIHSGAGNIRVRGGQWNSPEPSLTGVILGHEDPAVNSAPGNAIGPVDFTGVSIRAAGDPTDGEAILLLPSQLPNPAFQFCYHRFDMCNFLSNGGRLIRTARKEAEFDVTPMPVHISRPIFLGGTNGFGGYANGNLGPAGFDENNTAYNDHITYS